LKWQGRNRKEIPQNRRKYKRRLNKFKKQEIFIDRSGILVVVS
jgi:hypothetical protein